MNIISLLNLKGGVGKTTTSNNLAVGLAQKGFKVLLVDFDPQANTTAIFTSSFIKRGITYLLNHPQDVNQEIISTEYENLDLIPANLQLATAERSLLVSTGANHNKLQRVLRNLERTYDYCIIDCPPVLNLLVTNALFVSKEVIIPIKIDRFAIEGYQTTVREMQAIMDDFDLDIKFKILFTMVNRNNTDKHVMQHFNQFGNFHVFTTKIRTQHKPITQASFDRDVVIANKSNVGNDYKNLINEYLGETEKGV